MKDENINKLSTLLMLFFKSNDISIEEVFASMSYVMINYFMENNIPPEVFSDFLDCNGRAYTQLWDAVGKIEE